MSVEEPPTADRGLLEARGGGTGRLRRVIPSILILIGGVAVVVGALLTWLELTVAGISFASGIFIDGTARGTDLVYGIATLIAGAVLAVIGLLGVAFRRRDRWLTIAAIVFALISAALATYVLLTPESRFAEYAAKVAETDDPAALRERVQGFFKAGSLDVNAGTGLFIALGGSVVSLVGGLTSRIRRRRLAAPTTTPGDAGFVAGRPSE